MFAVHARDLHTALGPTPSPLGRTPAAKSIPAQELALPFCSSWADGCVALFSGGRSVGRVGRVPPGRSRALIYAPDANAALVVLCQDARGKSERFVSSLHSLCVLVRFAIVYVFKRARIKYAVTDTHAFERIVRRIASARWDRNVFVNLHGRCPLLLTTQTFDHF